VSELLKVEDLELSYGPYKALFGVSFSVGYKGATALVGPNGAGKSSIVRAIAGLVKPSSGKIYFEGKDITDMPAWRRVKEGIMISPEGRSIFSTLTVEENLKLEILSNIHEKKKAQQFLEKAYDFFPSLASRKDQIAGSLSGGEQKMLALVSALVIEPKLFVADEISLGLAPVALDSLYKALCNLKQKESALLIVEQKLDRVLNIADEVILVNKGTIFNKVPVDKAPAALKALMVS
jgi:branched-chain amino acid transport system ATP-binding protein